MTNRPFVVAILLVSLALSPSAVALEELPNEKEKLHACEKTFCSMILLKEKKGADLSCKLTKTWAKSDIKDGSKKKSRISWGFGDARCTTDVAMTRGQILAALTRPKHTIMLNKQEVNCIVERSDGEHKVRAVLSPKIKFEKGRADKVWINLKELEGPDDIKGTVWATAQIEDTLGLFHGAMIKGINKFVHRKCAKKYAEEFGLEPPQSRRAKKNKPDGKKTASAKDKKTKD